MRLQKYINEDRINIDITDYVNIINLLVKDCKPFLKELERNGLFKKEQFMYSGRQEDASIIKKKLRTDRKSLDTPDNIHDYVDVLFNKKFGWKARSNAIFCTGDPIIANAYGTTYLIFPIGKFKFLWSLKIEDFYDNIVVHNRIIKKSDFDKLPKYINMYKSTDLKNALSSGNEIMVNCKEYYGIVYNDYDYTMNNINGILGYYFNTYGITNATQEMIDKL